MTEPSEVECIGGEVECIGGPADGRRVPESEITGGEHVVAGAVYRLFRLSATEPHPRYVLVAEDVEPPAGASGSSRIW